MTPAAETWAMPAMLAAALLAAGCGPATKNRPLAQASGAEFGEAKEKLRGLDFPRPMGIAIVTVLEVGTRGPRTAPLFLAFGTVQVYTAST